MKLKLLREYEDRLLYISEECIAAGCVNDSPGAVSFEESSLYRRLNEEIAGQLSEEEKERLIEVTLPDSTEAAFLPEKCRGCRPDEKAVSEGVRTGGNGNCWWWLKSKGFAGDFYQIVDFAGHICSQGTYQMLKTNGIRPAVWLKK